MAYNYLDDVKGILKSKSGWANDVAKGGTGKAFADGAVQYYDSLRNAGRDDIADKLQKSDLSEAQAYYGILKGNTPTVEQNQAKSNDIYAVGKDYGKDIRQSYDKIYDNNINVNPLGTDYGRDIMKNYGKSADEAYDGTLKSGRANAGGNVDSFATANANRQKGAMVAQGHSDALNYYSTISGRANEWANGKATALSGNLKQLQDNVDRDREDSSSRYLADLEAGLQRESNAQNADIAKAQAENERYKYDTDRYVSDNSLLGTQFKAQSDLEGTIYKADSDFAGEQYKADRALQGDQVSANARIVASQNSLAGDMYKADKGGSSEKPVMTAENVAKSAVNAGKKQDLYGNYTVDWKTSDAQIQAILDDTSIDEGYRQQIADAYVLQGGKRLTVKGGSGSPSGTNEYDYTKYQTDDYYKLPDTGSSVDKYNDYIISQLKNPNISSEMAQEIVRKQMEDGYITSNAQAEFILKSSNKWTNDLTVRNTFGF